MCLIGTPSGTTAGQDVRGKVETLDWETGDQVALCVVVGVAVAVKTAEGIINADPEVAGEEVGEAQTSTHSCVASIVELSCGAGDEGIELDFTGTEEILLRGDDDFLG